MSAQTRMSGADTAMLGLGSVLVGSLPAALMTDDAPDRYTVEAVFTRRPAREEVLEIVGHGTQMVLVDAGYPAVRLTISDRRLEIANTTLEELRDGLGGVLADRLADISAGLRARQDAAETSSLNAAAREHVRADAVAALAEAVSFRTSLHSDAADEEQVRADRAQIDDWTDEGGHARR